VSKVVWLFVTAYFVGGLTGGMMNLFGFNKWVNLMTALIVSSPFIIAAYFVKESILLVPQGLVKKQGDKNESR